MIGVAGKGGLGAIAALVCGIVGCAMSAQCEGFSEVVAAQPSPPPDAPGFPSRAPDLDALPGFQNPPPGYGEVPFWWWTGDPLDKHRLLWQIEQLHEKGVAGMQVNYAHEDSPGWPTYPAEPPVFSDAWWDMWRFVAEECGKREMGIGLSGYTLDWPNGKSLVSSTIYSDPEIQGREIVIARKDKVGGGEAYSGAVPADTVAVRAYPLGGGDFGGGNIDLSERVRNEALSWTAPQGEWEVWIFTAPRLPGTLNPIHPLSGQRVVERFFQPFEDHAPGKSPGGLNYFFHDELQFGVGDRIWADDFPDEFKARKGYDLFEALPALFQDVGPSTVKYRLDFMDVKMQLAQERYFIPIFQWHWSRGKIYGCDQGSRGRDPLEFGDYFSAVRWYTAPGHDTPGGKADPIKGKVSSSIAQLYGRPRVWLEGYHSLGWGATPENLMYATRMNYVYGCTLLNLHGLYYSTHGSFWEWAPPCYHFRMPYWEHMGLFLKYFERLSYLMSQGSHQCDIAVMYPTEPCQAGLGGQEAIASAFAAGNALLEGGHDFIFMDAESLARADIRDRHLQVADASYRVLVLPRMRAIHWSSLQKAAEFFHAGGIVIAGGALPEASDRAGAGDPDLDAIVKTIFGASAGEVAAGTVPVLQNSAGGGVGLALLPDGRRPVRHYEGGFAGRWAWAKEPAQEVFFKGVVSFSDATSATCRIRFFCDNEGALFVNGKQLCSGADYQNGWTGDALLKNGDVITIDARDHDAPGTPCTAGMFLAVVRDGETVLTTEDLRYALQAPSAPWRSDPSTAGLMRPDVENVHPLHRGGGQVDYWATLPTLFPRDVQGPAGIRATHRRIGPRDVYLVMEAPKGSEVEFRAKGRAELWDPWTGNVQPLRVVSETSTGTRVQLPLERYEAQVVVFTPGLPHLNPPDPAQTRLTTLALDGEWGFELKPTMDNRFGDFRLPADAAMIGPEARIFRHAVDLDGSADWSRADLDDSDWEKVTYGFGPQFWRLGPLPSDSAPEKLEGALSAVGRIDPTEAVVLGDRRFYWQPYAFSWRLGVEGDPGHQGFHGLKEQVTDHFLCLGKPEDALNETRYVPEDAGSRYYLWTCATVADPGKAHLETSERQDGTPPHASNVLTPAAVFVNGLPVDDLKTPLELRAGPNPILVRYEQAGRGYFVLKREEATVLPIEATPLSMRWYDDPSVVRFDIYAGERPAEWFRFTAPPGLLALQVRAHGTVEAWADGVPMASDGKGHFWLESPVARACSIALRTQPGTGYAGAAVFPEPIRIECGQGLTPLGDWSRMGVLESYSGAAWYRKTFELTRQQAEDTVSIDLGKVIATAEVRVNGELAGTRVAPPWRVDLSGHLRAGANEVEVLVCNTLANHYLTIPTRYRGDLKSGLLGPVTLDIRHKK